MRRKWAKMALSWAERNGLSGSSGSLSSSIQKVSQGMRRVGEYMNL